MRWFVPLTCLVFFCLKCPALAQLRPSVPTGDFRVEGRLGTDPTVGPPGGPSLPPGPAAFRDSLGGKSPDEILKSIDKTSARVLPTAPSQRGQSGPLSWRENSVLLRTKSSSKTF